MNQKRTMSLRLEKKQAKDISESLGKVPPQALDLEESVLGALMLELPALKTVIEFLKPEHFYSEQHRVIYQAIIDLNAEDNPHDMRSVVNHLKKVGKIELIGGPLYIAQLTSGASGAGSVQYHSRIIMEKAMKRELIQVASEIHHNAYEDDSDVFELMDGAANKINEVQNWQERISVNAYIPPDMDEMKANYDNPKQIGMTSHASSEFDKVFRWTLGTVSAHYGWAGDGKGTIYDCLAVLKTNNDPDAYFCMAKPEDMNPSKSKRDRLVSADNIYLKLAWTLLGKCTIPQAAKELRISLAPWNEIKDAVEWVRNRFVIIYTQDVSVFGILEAFKHHQRRNPKLKYFLIDPWTAYEMEDRGRGDYTLRYSLGTYKRWVMQTDSRLDIITHPKTVNEVREKKGGPYKVVDQFLVAGGGAWDWACDQQFSTHAPERHLNLSEDVKRHFWNLKQKEWEMVGCKRGCYEKLTFVPQKRRYLFDMQDPFTGTIYSDQDKSGSINFKAAQTDSDDLPF